MTMHQPHHQPATSPADERFAELWTDYLEGELDAAGMAELAALLAAEERLVTRAADLYQLHRRLGLLAARRRDDQQAAQAPCSTESFVADVMQRLPVDGDTLARSVMSHIAPAREDDESAIMRQARRRVRWGRALLGGGVLAAAALAAVVLATRPQVAPAPRVEAQAALPVARFASLARAKFVGRDTPARESIVDANQSYVLSAGLVELAFPIGATAIVEGPAVFRVCGVDCLAVDAGRCSVHAPEGAEGFRVETPATQVIDRGTRFVVNVDETSATEVQVIEGAADLIAKTDPANTVHRLATGDSARHDPAARGARVVATAGGADRSAYRPSLPDRLIKYTASLAHPVPMTAGDSFGPGIDTLESVTVQRAGRLQTYDVADLIGVKLMHFSATRNQNNLTLPGQVGFTAATLDAADARRGLLETDRLLTTGAINPGGAKSPLTADPVLVGAGMHGGETTPGLGVAFTRPVINSSGPDVILFDLQMITDPAEGDAFHVSPLRFAPGLRTHTVIAYDIDSTSPESQLLAPFRLFSFESKPVSLADWLKVPTNSGRLVPVRSRGNAVAIDLSDLGYAPGASCEGLFIQDADDDKTTVDPVFIAGLPPLERNMP
jgi:hypothetical protein